MVHRASPAHVSGARVASARRVLAVLCLVLAAAGPAAAQPATPLPAEGPPARVQIGPVGLRPALILREIGYDSNVLNETTGEKGDFTATFGARLDVGVRVPKVVAAYNTFYEYLYFAELDEERGSNRGAEGRVDFLLGRLRPHVLAGVRKSHDRPTPEIDARALRQATSIGFGLNAAAFSRTSLAIAYRRNATEYADDETFRGVPLGEELNEAAHSVVFGADFELSPLTTVSVHGEELRERFSLSPDRDADSHRYGATALLNPLALISGRATVGLAAFRPASPLVSDFTGLVAAIGVGYTFRGESKVAVTFDRDVRHSYLEETPYYVATGLRLTYSQRLVRNLDGEVTAGWDRIAYEARLDADAATNEHDSLTLYGGGVAMRLSDQTRIGLNFDYTRRASPVDSREYSRGRLLATVTYGF